MSPAPRCIHYLLCYFCMHSVSPRLAWLVNHVLYIDINFLTLCQYLSRVRFSLRLGSVITSPYISLPAKSTVDLIHRDLMPNWLCVSKCRVLSAGFSWAEKFLLRGAAPPTSLWKLPAERACESFLELLSLRQDLFMDLEAACTQ